jgi:hypothetical protein
MSTATKTRATTGLAAVITGVLLIGTTGLTFVVGWALWAAGVVALLAAVPAGGGTGSGRRRRTAAVTRRYSVVR